MQKSYWTSWTHSQINETQNLPSILRLEEKRYALVYVCKPKYFLLLWLGLPVLFPLQVLSYMSCTRLPLGGHALFQAVSGCSWPLDNKQNMGWIFQQAQTWDQLFGTCWCTQVWLWGSVLGVSGDSTYAHCVVFPRISLEAWALLSMTKSVSMKSTQRNTFSQGF